MNTEVSNRFKIVAFTIGLFFAVPVFYDFFIQGHFKWHIRQPSVVEGAAELVVVYFMLNLGAYLFKSYRMLSICLIVVPLILYMRRHNIDYSLIITSLYALNIYTLGALLLRRSNKSYLVPLRFVVGSSALVALYMLLSIFKVATPIVLISINIALSFISIVLLYPKIKLYRINFNNLGWKDNAVLLAILMVFLIIITQATQKPSYDELWYSLRGAEVLNNSGSFYEKIVMMQHWVSYYPKFYEVLIYPLEFFKSYTVSRAFGSMVLFFFVCSIYEFLTHRIERLESLIAILAVVSVPAVANTSVLAKQDLFVAFTTCLSLFIFISFCNQKKISLLLFSGVLLILTLALKITALPYIAVLSIVYIIVAIYISSKIQNDLDWLKVFSISVVLLAISAITLRTFLLVGVPFVSLIENISIFEKIYSLMGFELAEGYSKIVRQNIVENQRTFLDLFVLYNLQPVKTRLVFAWISSIYSVSILFLIGSLLANTVSKRKSYKFNISLILLTLISAVFVFVLYVLMGSRKAVGGDGNYHIFAIVSIFCLTVYMLGIKRLIYYILPIIMVNFLILFVTNHSWSFGTRALDLNFLQTPFDKEKNRLKFINQAAAADIYKHLKNYKGNARILGAGPEQELFALGVTYESGIHILQQRPEYAKNMASFKRLIDITNTTHLLLPKAPSHVKFYYLAERLKNCRSAVVFEGRAYYLINIESLESYCYKELSPDVSAKIYDVLHEFKTPDEVLHAEYHSNTWIRPYALINNDYFGRGRGKIAIRNNTKIIFNNIHLSSPNSAIRMVFMRDIAHPSISEQGVLNLKISDLNGVSIQRKIDINPNSINEFIIPISKVDPENISIQVEHSNWSHDTRLVFSNFEAIAHE